MFIRKPSGSWRTTQITGKGAGCWWQQDSFLGCAVGGAISAGPTHLLCMVAAAWDRTGAVFMGANPTSYTQGTPAGRRGCSFWSSLALSFGRLGNSGLRDQGTASTCFELSRTHPPFQSRLREWLPQYNSPAPLQTLPDTFTGSTPT